MSKKNIHSVFTRANLRSCNTAIYKKNDGNYSLILFGSVSLPSVAYFYISHVKKKKNQKLIRLGNGTASQPIFFDLTQLHCHVNASELVCFRALLNISLETFTNMTRMMMLGEMILTICHTSTYIHI